MSLKAHDPKLEQGQAFIPHMPQKILVTNLKQMVTCSLCSKLWCTAKYSKKKVSVFKPRGSQLTELNPGFCCMKWLWALVLTLYGVLCSGQIEASTSPCPPCAYPRHLTVILARGGGNLNVALKGWGIWTRFISCSIVIHPWVFSVFAKFDGFSR